MKNRENFVRAETLLPQEESVREYLKTKAGVAAAVCLVMALVDVLDYSLAGNDGFVSFGVKRDRTAVLLTQTFGTQKVYIAGAGMKEVLDQVHKVYQDEI